MNRNKLRLAQSLEKLVAQKPLTKLTIGEICDDAMLSRAMTDEIRDHICK